MVERYFVKKANCYVAFLGIFHEPTMKADYHKATPFFSEAEAREEAIERGMETFKVVKKLYKVEEK